MRGRSDVLISVVTYLFAGGKQQQPRARNRMTASASHPQNNNGKAKSSDITLGDDGKLAAELVEPIIDADERGRGMDDDNMLEEVPSNNPHIRGQ